MHPGQPEKSAVAEHKYEIDHNTEFGNITVLDKTLGYMECLIKETTEIRLHPRNFNRDRAFNLSWSWYLLTNIIKQR
jgi:hypothetical protein